MTNNNEVLYVLQLLKPLSGAHSTLTCVCNMDDEWTRSILNLYAKNDKLVKT